MASDERIEGDMPIFMIERNFAERLELSDEGVRAVGEAQPGVRVEVAGRVRVGGDLRDRRDTGRRAARETDDEKRD